jgi:uncharacterized membrane protein YqaE (UPF0057 family)
MVVKRTTVAICNVLFPPLAVWMLCGVGEDLLINSVLFLLAVIPSHVHGFYLSWTYFNRKRKIRKGQYPGGLRPMIYSDKVQNGGASSKEIRQLKKGRDIEKKEKLVKKHEDGRARRLFRKIIHRKGPETNDGYSYDTEKGYSESNTISYEPSTIQRITSRRQSEPLMVSRPSSRRNSNTAPVAVNNPPRRRESAHRSHPPRAILQSPLLQRSGSNRIHHFRSSSMHEDDGFNNHHIPSMSRRNSIGSRINSQGRSVSSNGEALTDYVARPALPQRPGSSYRDDIDRWRRSVPVDVQ